MVRRVTETQLSTWRPSPEQRKVAELLATGYSQNRAAAICGVPQQTISDWWTGIPRFVDLVDEIEAQFEEVRVLDQTIRLAELLHHQAVTGERPADDPSVVLARELLSQTSWKVYAQGGHKQFGAP